MIEATAILMFSRSATAEAAEKRYSGAARTNERVANALIDRTRRTLERTSYDTYFLDEGKQRGHGFGARLSNAVTDIFARGYSSLIIVGNDCPTLNRHHLEAAAGQLASGKSIVGADRRGGAYLIGLTADDFCPQTFVDLPWQTGELFSALVRFLDDPARLAVQIDVNTLNDLRISWFFLRCRLALLGDLAADTIDTFAGERLVCTFCAPRFSGRAPPVVI